MFSNYKKNPDVINSYLYIKDNALCTKEDINIVYPSRFLDKGLVDLDNVIKLTSIFAITDYNKNYAVVCLPIMQTFTPSGSKEVKYKDVNYSILQFDKNTVVNPNMESVINSTLTQVIFDEFIVQGKIPWYLDYKDIPELFSKADKYARVSLGDNPLTFEIIAALITRKTDNKLVYHRQAIKEPYSYVGLNNVYYGYTNTDNKLIGGYFSEGIVTSLVSPEKETTNISKIFRS